MKYARICLLILLALILCACGQEESATVYTVAQDGVRLTVDTENMTITHGTDVYRFEINSSTVTVYYPNGATYYQEFSDSLIHGGGIGDYDSERYVDSGILIAAITDAMPQEDSLNIVPAIVGVVLIIWGFVSVLYPEVAFRAKFWKYNFFVKDVEPADGTLAWFRFTGVVGIIVGVVCFFFV